jgi:hypothetical protein
MEMDSEIHFKGATGLGMASDTGFNEDDTVRESTCPRLQDLHNPLTPAALP